MTPTTCMTGQEHQFPAPTLAQCLLPLGRPTSSRHPNWGCYGSKAPREEILARKVEAARVSHRRRWERTSVESWGYVLRRWRQRGMVSQLSSLEGWGRGRNQDLGRGRNQDLDRPRLEGGRWRGWRNPVPTGPAREGWERGKVPPLERMAKAASGSKARIKGVGLRRCAARPRFALPLPCCALGGQAVHARTTSLDPIQPIR